MATLQDNGYFYCKACGRDDLTRADYYVDNSKKYGLSNLCKRCESERTKKPKHDHYMRSERHQQSLRRQSKRRYYLKNREEIMIKSRAYKRREPGRIRGYLLKPDPLLAKAQEVPLPTPTLPAYHIGKLALVGSARDFRADALRREGCPRFGARAAPHSRVVG